MTVVPDARPHPLRRVARVLRQILTGLGAFLLLGNLTILGSALAFRWLAGEAPPVTGVEGIEHLRAVDAKVWRGAHPDAEGYRALAAHGVTTVVDLRAEDDAAESDPIAEAAGLEVIHLPVRDGQVPSADEIATFLKIVAEADGRVFLHCGAGVGRTGTMAAAYLVATGQASPGEALTRNLAVGPPSLEQIIFVHGLGGGWDRPHPLVVATSRLLDAPRRIFLNL